MRTDSCAVLNISADIKISPMLNLLAGMDNIPEHYYTEHLSGNNFPQPGRNISVAVNLRF